MQQKELAALLGVSPAMVSRHAKQGMPTDTLERAQRWRKRHLETGRTKGNRFEPSRKPVPPVPKASSETPIASTSFTEIESVGEMVNAALLRGNHYGAAVRTWQLRGLLRQSIGDAGPRLTVRVWLSLLDYILHEDAEVRHAPDMGELLTPGEVGTRFGDHATPAHVIHYEACDFDHDALNGWPVEASND